MSLPYESATAGDQALVELQRTLAKFGCQSFGTGTDAERGMTTVSFRWRNREVRLEASWKGYAQAMMRDRKFRREADRRSAEARALLQGRVSVCSCLRDWVKGQVTAVECGVLSFEAAFMPHMLLKDGRRVLEHVQSSKLLAGPADG